VTIVASVTPAQANLGRAKDAEHAKDAKDATRARAGFRRVESAKGIEV
jgi:hypothetical protein